MGSFRIGEFDVKVIKRVEQKRTNYPLCDSEGNEVMLERIPAKTVYKNKDGVVISKTYRLISRKPYDKFKRTERVNKYTEVPRTEVYDLISECFYYCECEELREKLQQEDKALKFIYTNGGGYKGYIAYLMSFQDKLVMVCGFGSITQQIKAIDSEREVTSEQQEKVEVAQPEQLLVIEKH